MMIDTLKSDHMEVNGHKLYLCGFYFSDLNQIKVITCLA